MSEVAINEIMVPKTRFRKEFPDLDKLAESIAALGLLQPIVLTPEMVLLAGERRLRACRDILKWKTIEVVYRDVDALQAEQDENEMRVPFTISERAAIGAAIRKASKRQGKRPTSDQMSRSRDEAAKRAGFNSGPTMDRAIRVVEKGVPELVTAMDSGAVSIAQAASIAELSDEEQRKVLSGGGKERRRKEKSDDPSANLVDPNGRDVPETLADIFADRTIGKAIEVVGEAFTLLDSAALCQDLTAKVKSIAWLDLDAVDDRTAIARKNCQLVKNFLESAKPYCVCPSCQGAGCQECRQSGWMPEWRYKEWLGSFGEAS